jgi:threonine synthase
MSQSPAVDTGPRVSLNDAVLSCLPPDGGLYIPSGLFDLKEIILGANDGASYPELAAALASALLEGELEPDSIIRAAESTFDFKPELQRVDENLSVLNLYNGPTGDFKDYSAAFYSALLDELHFPSGNVLKNNRKAIVLSAVRGDSGACLSEAFHGHNGFVSVMIFPAGQVRGLNPAFFVPNGGNIIPIQIKGTLDDCHRLIKETIHDRPFAERYLITSSNSVNPGMILPQAICYLYAFVKIKKTLSGGLFFSVPSGSLGNLLSGLYAWKFGLPVNGFLASVKAKNDRFRFFYDQAPSVIRNMIFPSFTDDASSERAMESAWKKYGVLLDPHSASAFAATEDFIKSKKFHAVHTVVLSTGHPAREAGLVKTATGQVVSLPENLFILKKESDPIALIEPQLAALEGVIASCL